MTEHSGEQKAHLPQNQTEKERIESALLTPADTWREKVVSSDRDPAEWLDIVNETIPKAIKTIKRGGGAHSPEALETKAAREKFFSECGMTTKGHELYGVLHKILNMHRGTYPSPEPFIHNVRELSTLKADVVKTIKSNPDFFTHYVDLGSSREVGLADDILSKAGLLVYEPNFLKDKRNIALRLARPLGLSDEFEAAIAEKPTLLKDMSAMRQIVMARIALEFYNTQGFTPKDIVRFSHESVESVLIAGLEKQSATITDAKAVSNQTYNAAGHERKGRHRPTQERRERLMALLNSPANLKVLGNAAINSYFIYRPITKVERSNYIVASLFDKKSIDDQSPRLNRSHFEWLERLVDDGTKLDNNWLRQANLLAVLGSKAPRKNKEIVNAARCLFFESLGLGASSQDKSKGQTSERFANPLNFISHVKLLSQYNIHNIDEIAQHSFRIFYESQDTLIDKLETIAAQGFDLADSSIQKYLATVLRQKTREIKNGAMAKQFRKPADKKKAASSHRKRPPRRTAVRSIASKEVPTEQPADPITLENWRHLHSKPEKEDKKIDEATLSVASTICMILESTQPPDIMADILNLQALSQTQLGELATSIDKKYIAGEDITMGVIRKKLKEYNQ